MGRPWRGAVDHPQALGGWGQEAERGAVRLRQADDAVQTSTEEDAKTRKTADIQVEWNRQNIFETNDEGTPRAMNK